MSLLLFLSRAVLLVTWLCAGLLSVIVIYPFVSLNVRNAMARCWSAILMVICGVKIRVLGQPCLNQPVLWVANHVSWVDIFVLNAIRSTAFVAKSEIRRWPLIGWLVAGAGTVFIERGQRQAIRTVGEKMQVRFGQGEAIGLFPEGTTSPGFSVSPFHSSLFEPAIRAGVVIQPVALRFFHQGQRSDYAAFVGDQNLVENLWRLLGATQIVVEVEYLSVISHEQSLELGRSKTSAQAHRAVSQAI